MKVIAKLQLDDDFDDKLRKHIRNAVDKETECAERSLLKKKDHEPFSYTDYESAEQIVLSQVRRLVNKAYKVGVQYGATEFADHEAD